MNNLALFSTSFVLVYCRYLGFFFFPSATRLSNLRIGFLCHTDPSSNDNFPLTGLKAMIFLLTICITLGMFLNFSEPWFLDVGK